VLLHDRATRYVSKFVLFHEMWVLEKFQRAKITLKYWSIVALFFHEIV